MCAGATRLPCTCVLHICHTTSMLGNLQARSHCWSAECLRTAVNVPCCSISVSTCRVHCSIPSWHMLCVPLRIGSNFLTCGALCLWLLDSSNQSYSHLGTAPMDPHRHCPFVAHGPTSCCAHNQFADLDFGLIRSHKTLNQNSEQSRYVQMALTEGPCAGCV